MSGHSASTFPRSPHRAPHVTPLSHVMLPSYQISVDHSQQSAKCARSFVRSLGIPIRGILLRPIRTSSSLIRRAACLTQPRGRRPLPSQTYNCNSPLLLLLCCLMTDRSPIDSHNKRFARAACGNMVGLDERESSSGRRLVSRQRTQLPRHLITSHLSLQIRVVLTRQLIL